MGLLCYYRDLLQRNGALLSSATHAKQLLLLHYLRAYVQNMYVYMYVYVYVHLSTYIYICMWMRKQRSTTRAKQLRQALTTI